MEAQKPEKFDCHAIIEIMGHQTVAGRVTTVQVPAALPAPDAGFDGMDDDMFDEDDE